MTTPPDQRPHPTPPAPAIEDSPGSRAGVLRGFLMALGVVVAPCVLTPVTSRWLAMSRLESGDVHGPRAVVLGDHLGIARDVLDHGTTPRARATAAYALRVCREPGAALTPGELALLRRAASSDPDANVRVAATDVLLSIAGRAALGAERRRLLEGDTSPLDPTLHQAAKREPCAHAREGQATVSHHVSCVLDRPLAP